MMIYSLFLMLCSLGAVTSTRVTHRFLPSGPVKGVNCEAKMAHSSEMDAYISVFKPCEITFYGIGETSRNRRRFLLNRDQVEEWTAETYNKTIGQKCDDLTDDLDVIKVTERKVFMLPDSCVSQMDVCFDVVTDKDILENSILFFNTTYQLDFPEGATVASVNCKDDHDTLVEFVTVFSTLSALFDWLKTTLIVFLLFVVCLLVGVIMMFCGGTVRLICCLCCCCCKPKKTQYTPIPTAPPTAPISAKIV